MESTMGHIITPSCAQLMLSIGRKRKGNNWEMCFKFFHSAALPPSQCVGLAHLWWRQWFKLGGEGPSSVDCFTRRTLVGVSSTNHTSHLYWSIAWAGVDQVRFYQRSRCYMKVKTIANIFQQENWTRGGQVGVQDGSAQILQLCIGRMTWRFPFVAWILFLVLWIFNIIIEVEQKY